MSRLKLVPVAPRVRPSPEEAEEQLQQRVRELEQELEKLKDEGGAAGEAPPSHRGEGLLVALARGISGLRRGLSWERVARLWSEVYFAWHSDHPDDFGYDPVFTRTLQPFFEFLYTVWWRVETEGVGNVPAAGPALIVANHSGVLPWDGPMINLAVRHEHPARRECRMLALDMFALMPFLAPLVAQTGGVRANQENGERLLRRGELVGVFPEGVKGIGKPYRQRYKLARFGRGGFVRLALRTGAPIVPCAVVGAEEIHPLVLNMPWLARPLGVPYLPVTPTFPALGPLGFIPLPSKWSIDFGDPIAVEQHGPGGADDPILVNRLTQQVRAVIQRMIDGRLARRRSVWFG
jgi:1-acyl-sn-glycerol-3-phosphate acyltransferase